MEKIKQIGPIIVIIAMSVMMVLGFFKYQSLSKVVTISNKFHKESLEQEKRYREELKKEKNQIIKEYEEKNHELEKKYKSAVWRLSQERKKNKEKIINYINSDPEKVKQEWKKEFGFEYVQADNNVNNSN